MNQQIKEIELILNDIYSANDLELLLLEARMKRLYYSCFDDIILNKDFSFRERSTFPPQNEVNAMMSFGYAILYGKLESIILLSRLEISLPFVHGHSKPNTGLHHDIADIFKPIFVDRLIFRLINKDVIQQSDFEGRDGGVYLNKTGMKKWITHFEKFMKETIKIGTKSYSKQQLLSREINRIANHVFKNHSYEGYVMTKW